jgi:ArsR family transcriptional regulator
MQDFIKATKALSDETRLRIMNILSVRECCVCEVMQALQISQTRASRNLSILYEAGFLTQRKEGLWTYYAIDTGSPTKKRTLFRDDIVQAISHIFEDNQTGAEDTRRLKKSQKLSAISNSDSKNK